MYQSSTRNNFLDILLDPTALAVLGSIAIHAITAASLPFFTQPQNPDKKGEPGTVKVLELTPGELQRIPQAPTPLISQKLPPVYQPSTPIPPRTPQVSIKPQTIPSSPFRTPTKGSAKSSSTTKGQKAIPQAQPSTPLFDPNITFQPTPKPSQSPKPGNTTKQSPQPSPAPLPANQKSITASPQPQPNPGTNNDGSEQLQPQSPPATSGNTNQPATPTPQSPISPQTSPGSQPSGGTGNGGDGDGDGGDGDGDNSGNATGNGVYGQYTRAANDKLRGYLVKYPDIIPYKPKLLSPKYPPGVPCTKVKQPPFIVLMVAFDKIPPGQDSNILRSVTSPLLENEKPYLDGDPTTLANKKLLELATDAGFTDATTADKNRPEADKGKPVLYQYRVQFDPASCKN